MKKYLLVFYFSIVFLFSDNLQNCKNVYKKAWSLYNKGQYMPSQTLINSCTVKDKITEDWINVLQGMLSYRFGEYSFALQSLDKSRESVVKAYNNRKVSLRENELQCHIRTLYLSMFSFYGFTNSQLGNYQLAINYFNLCREENDNSSPVYEYTGVCYYHLKDYTKAIYFLKKAYHYRALDSKDVIAFSIACVYAKKGDFENMKKWIKEPLKKDYNLYLHQIEEETDFDEVRNTDKFQQLLSTYKD